MYVMVDDESDELKYDNDKVKFEMKDLVGFIEKMIY